MKYKANNKKFEFIPETLKDAYFLGTKFNDVLGYNCSINFVNGELKSVTIKCEDILSMIGDKCSE